MASAPDIEQFGVLLFSTARAWLTRLDQRLRPLGFSQGKWRTLMNLSTLGDGVTQKELAERLSIEEPTLAGLVGRLETAGWVERRESPNDRRCKIVHLQKRSKRVLDKMFDTAHDLRHELIAGIPRADLDTCMRVLAQIRDRASGSTNTAAKSVRRNGTR